MAEKFAAVLFVIPVVAVSDVQLSTAIEVAGKRKLEPILVTIAIMMSCRTRHVSPPFDGLRTLEREGSAVSIRPPSSC
jgi:hypothetical protein